MTQQMLTDLKQYGRIESNTADWVNPPRNYWNLYTKPNIDRKSLATELERQFPEYHFNPFGRCVINNMIYNTLEISKN